MNKKTLLKNLEKAAKWVASKQRDHDEAVNTMVGCFQILGQAGQKDVTAWIDRKPDRRRVLSDVREKYLSVKGNKVLRDLVSLTISAVKACNWVDDWSPGALKVEITSQRHLTKSHIQKMQEGRARKKAALERLRKKQIQKQGVFR